MSDWRAFLALGLHLARHRVDEILRRLDVFDLDARDLDAPGLGGRVDDIEQAGVDLVAMRQQLIEVHRTHDCADIGHDEVQEGELEVGDLVGGPARVEHLIERDAVDRDRGVVPGDDFLTRHVDHLLHHIELVADRVDIGKDQSEARRQSLVVLAETLDGVIEALRHLPHAHEGGDDDERDDHQSEDADPLDHDDALQRPKFLARRRFGLSPQAGAMYS
jgi:hypothetical protein